MRKWENFTEDRIAKFKCESGKQQSIFWDGRTPGLGLRVTAPGSKSFIFESRLYGKTLRTTIGDARTWSIAKAQAEATRLKSLTDQGIDPREIERSKIEAKNAAAMAAEASVTYTLEKLFEAYCDFLIERGKHGSARSARCFFNVHADAKLRKTPARDVSAESIADMLRTVTEKGKTRTAGALRSYLLAAFNVGLHAKFDPTLPIAFKSFGIANNPVTAIRAIASNTSDRVVTPDELRIFLRAMDGRQSDLALQLALYAGGQRMEQILRATVDDWAPETKTLRLLDPKGRRAQPRVHLLPLGDNASRVVEALIAGAKAVGVQKLFTIHHQTPGIRVKQICTDCSIRHAFDLRDLRRTVETRMAEMGISKDTRAQILSHGLGGVQDKHYDRHSYTTEKRTALVAWENWLEATVKNEQPITNVVAIERKTAA